MERFIDAAVEQFARDHTEPETDLYTRLREETYQVMQRPQMQIDVIEGRFLQLLVRLSGAKSILELGMFTGYSALMMAEALPDNGQLITCEIDAKAEAIARRYFEENPHGRKITVRMGPALDTIKTWTGPLDLVFVDADKPNYSNYYNLVFDKLRPGGFIIADNVLWSGEIVDESITDENVTALLTFNDKVAVDDRVEVLVLPAFDGLTIARKI